MKIRDRLLLGDDEGRRLRERCFFFVVFKERRELNVFK